MSIKMPYFVRQLNVLMLALLLLAGYSSAYGNPGQGQMPANSKNELVHLLPTCNQLPTGGVCLRLDDGKIELLHVQGNVYMISGAGGNITVQVGEQSVTVVNTGLAPMSDKVIGAIHALTEKPIYTILVTSLDEDLIGGNANFSKAGWATPNSDNIPFGHDVSDILALKFPSGAAIIANINVLNRMSAPTGQKSPVPSELWPTDTYDADFWRMYNSEEIYLYHPQVAHSDGDSFVLFRRSGVISTGDLFNPMVSYPVIDLEKGGGIDGFIDGLNQIIDLLVPEDAEEGGTYVIPGHGRICDRNDVVNYRDMVTILRARISEMIEQGMTLEQVKAAEPTSDYDVTGHYAASKDQFIEAVYRDKIKSKVPRQNASAPGAR